VILLGCLLAFGAAIAPRVILVLAWIFSERWVEVWSGQILVPLLGIILLPYTTIMFMLAVTVTPTGNVIEGFAWLWILLGVLLDIWKWTGIVANRQVGYEKGKSVFKDLN
jgi:hypothetical protein